MAMERQAVLNVINQTGMESKKNTMQKYESKPYPTLTKTDTSEQLPQKKTTYQAVITYKRNERSSRFRIIHTSDNKSYGCGYAHLVDWTFISPNLLILNTSTRVFTIEGKKLGNIEQFFLEEKVKELQVFNPKIHDEPSEEEPIIEKMEITEQD